MLTCVHVSDFCHLVLGYIRFEKWPPVRRQCLQQNWLFEPFETSEDWEGLYEFSVCMNKKQPIVDFDPGQDCSRCEELAVSFYSQNF